MIYRTFGKTGWRVSVVGLGTWNLGNQWGELSDQEATDILLTAIDNGMNLLDTAESYGIPNGMSELRIGKTLTPSMRDKLIIVSKIGNWGSRTGAPVPKTGVDAIRLCGHACLGRMQTDRIDVMLCHEGSIEDPSVYIEGFDTLCEEGFVRTYGISTNSLSVLKNFYELSNGVCAVVEVDYSLINRKPEAGFLDYCTEKNLGILVRGPLAKGVLSGKYNRESVFADTVRDDWNPGQLRSRRIRRHAGQSGDDQTNHWRRLKTRGNRSPVYHLSQIQPRRHPGRDKSRTSHRQCAGRCRFTGRRPVSEIGGIWEETSNANTGSF